MLGGRGKMHGGFSISKSVFFISITLVYCSAAKPYSSSVQWIGKRTIGAMKLHQHFEFGDRFAGSIFILPNTARSWYSVESSDITKPYPFLKGLSYLQ
jgi:hypothetical protein